MSFEWLKRYMPRGLYGRAALILILPVVTLQLVVSVVFIQRHFEGVTEQMSRDLARAANYAIAAQPDAVVLRALDLQLQEISTSEMPVADRRRWYDFSGITVVRTLRDHVRGIVRLDLPDDRAVWLYVQSADALYQLRVDRGRASPSNPHQLLVNMAFFGGLMTVIGFLYLRNQLRPITRLARAAAAFGRGRTVPYSPSGAVEVRAAGHAFLDMRQRIERQIEQRTMMLSGVSHDLRTPLTRLRLGLSMLDDAEREPLERDVEDMQRLIDAFLDFARSDAESGEAEPTDPIDLVTRIVDDCKRAGQNVALGQVSGEGEISLRPAALRRAVENLIGNAVRYGTAKTMAPGSRPRIVRRRSARLCVWIPPATRTRGRAWGWGWRSRPILRGPMAAFCALVRATALVGCARISSSRADRRFGRVLQVCHGFAPVETRHWPGRSGILRQASAAADAFRYLYREGGPDMALCTVVTLAALGLSSITADMPDQSHLSGQARPVLAPHRGAATTPGADHRTTPEGCTYRRTRLPGYRERWILVITPQLTERSGAIQSCAGMR